MPLRIELYEAGSLVDGVEEWWDDVANAVATAASDYPLLTSISPYGDLDLSPGMLEALAEECRRLASETTIKRLADLLLKTADLCERAATSEAAVLRFDGD